MVVLVGAIVASGCVAVPESNSTQLKDARQAVQYNARELQALVRRGHELMKVGPCREATLLGVLDERAAGDRLEELLDKVSASSGVPECLEVVAFARAIRLARIGDLDLLSDARHRLAVVRIAALRLATLTGSQLAPEILAATMVDPDEQVRIAAYFAAAALGDASTIERLRRLAPPTSASESYWHCKAQAYVDPTLGCDTQGFEIDVIAGTGDGAGEDHCQRASAALAGPERRDALWFIANDAFHRLAQPLDRLAPPIISRSGCALERGTELDVLTSSSADPEERAIVAAHALWRDHPPLGVAKFTNVATRSDRPNDDVITCKADVDCPSHTRCIPLPGFGSEGVCGNPKRAADRSTPRYRVEVRSTGCWSFVDCPPFYSCYYLHPTALHGVCLRR